MTFSEDDLKFLRTENRSHGHHTWYIIICIMLLAGFLSLSAQIRNSKPTKQINIISNQTLPRNTKEDAQQVLNELRELQRRRDASTQRMENIVKSLKDMQSPNKTRIAAGSVDAGKPQSRPRQQATRGTAPSPKPEIQDRDSAFSAYRAYSEAENTRMAEKIAREKAAFDRNKEAQQVQRLREAQIQAVEDARRRAQNSNQSAYTIRQGRRTISRTRDSQPVKPVQP